MPPELVALIAHLTPARIALALLAVNLIAFALFAHDKRLAVAGARWRVAESTLLLWAALGGTPGAYAARRLLRHKTRKQPFVSRLRTVLVLQLAALAAAGWWCCARAPAPLSRRTRARPPAQPVRWRGQPSNICAAGGFLGHHLSSPVTTRMPR